MSDAKVREVAPGVFVVHLPLPARPTIVNVTLLRGGQEWALVDTGVNSTDSSATFAAALQQVGCTPERIGKILCTHHHPDHFGATKTYKDLCGAEVFIHRRDYESAQWFAPRQRSAAAVQFVIRHGFPIAHVVSLPSPAEMWGSLYAPATPDHFMEDGEVIHVGDLEIEVITTPGHTAGHCVLYLRRQRVLLAGDHLLPKITPHVGVYPQGPANPLADFLDSLRKVQPLAVDLVLPAHGGVYTEHRHRINQILHHHEYRLQEIFDLVRHRARTAYEVATLAFGFDIESPLAVQFPATFETLAHLEYLRAGGKVARQEGSERTLYQAM